MTAEPGPIPRFDGYVFDLDGTVYLDDEALPGAVDVITRLRADGARVVFATNKPLEQAADYAAKLTRLGIDAGPHDVVTALDSLLSYLLERHLGATLLCVAESVVVQTLRREGFAITDEPQGAEAVVGKPSPQMAAVLLERLGVPAERAVIIGDRLTTDVGMGLATGMTGALVLTGATSRADLGASDIAPDFVLTSLHDLISDPDEGTPR